MDMRTAVYVLAYLLLFEHVRSFTVRPSSRGLSGLFAGAPGQSAGKGGAGAKAGKPHKSGKAGARGGGKGGSKVGQVSVLAYSGGENELFLCIWGCAVAMDAYKCLMCVVDTACCIAFSYYIHPLNQT